MLEIPKSTGINLDNPLVRNKRWILWIGLVLFILVAYLTFYLSIIFKNTLSKLNLPQKSNAIVGFETRSDGAFRVTNCTGTQSCQNPVFSPDAQFILFTRFENGYNIGPSELVKINLETHAETIIIPAQGSDNVNVPFGSWIGNKITFSSDRAGGSDEIFTANNDGSNITQVTNHDPSLGHFFEPVFNPTNTNKIVFEFSTNSSTAPHHLKLLELDKGGQMTDLTSDPNFNDRNPSWSKDGTQILWQRSPALNDNNYQIFAATISLGSFPSLSNLRKISQSSSNDTDNSWAANDSFVLSSSDFGGVPAANVFAFPSSGTGTVIRISNSFTKQDGAASYGPDDQFIAFESHSSSVESDPANIWLTTASLIAPSPSPSNSPSPTPSPSPGPIWQPAVNTSWQIQLQKKVNQHVKAQMYDIDGFNNDKSVVDSLHAKGRKVICYIDVGSWEDFRPDANQYPDSVKGNIVAGFADERWLDIRRLDILGPLIENRMDLCKQKGFNGVDADNIDGFTNNPGFPLTSQDQINFNTFVANAAHARGLSIGFKNDAEQIPNFVSLYDFAINESCFDFNECDAYLPFINAGKAVFQIEYNLNTSQFCPQANSLNFNSIKKHPSLDAFRIPCR